MSVKKTQRFYRPGSREHQTVAEEFIAERFLIDEGFKKVQDELDGGAGSDRVPAGKTYAAYVPVNAHANKLAVQLMGTIEGGGDYDMLIKATAPTGTPEFLSYNPTGSGAGVIVSLESDEVELSEADKAALAQYRGAAVMLGNQESSDIHLMSMAVIYA